MPERRVLIVGETPSLGRSIADLLEADGLPVRFVLDAESERPWATLADRFPVLVVASAGYFCSTVRRWARGEIPRGTLVVVGSHDPLVRPAPGLTAVPLPLAPGPLVGMVRHLLLAASGAPASGPPPGSDRSAPGSG